MRRGRKGVCAKLLACSTGMLSARPLLPRPGCCPHPRHGSCPTLPRRLTLNPGRHPLLYHLHQLSLPPPRPSWRQVAVWPSKPTSLPSSPVHRLTLGALPPPIISSGRRDTDLTAAETLQGSTTGVGASPTPPAEDAGCEFEYEDE